MNNHHSGHQFAAAGITRTRGLDSSDHELVIKQAPRHAKLFLGKEKDRKPIDPPPIVQLRINLAKDPNQNYLQSPYYFISCCLLDTEDSQLQNKHQIHQQRDEVKNGLAGTLVSSLHRLKDVDNNDGGFFVFGDLSVKLEGQFRLMFTLYEVRDREVEHIRSIVSDPFTVHAAKNFPGMGESTFLTRSFSDQGVRLRLRKEPRLRLNNRGPASDDYHPRHYNTQKRQRSRAESPPGQAATGGYSQTQDIYDTSRQVTHAISGVPYHGQRPDANDYSGFAHNHQSLQQNAAIPSAEGIMENPPHKRVFLNPGQSNLYASADDLQLKRVRLESEQSQQQLYGQNYTLQPQYLPGRTLSHSASAQQLGGFTQSLSLSNLQSYNTTEQSPSRARGGYFTPRQPETQYGVSQNSYETPTVADRSPQFPTGVHSNYAYDSPQQSMYNPMQGQQPQYRAVPAENSNVRSSYVMANYGSANEQERANFNQTSMLQGDMPNTTYGWAPTVSSSIQGGLAQLPVPSSMPDEPRHSGIWTFDGRQRGNMLPR